MQIKKTYVGFILCQFWNSLIDGLVWIWLLPEWIYCWNCWFIHLPVIPKHMCFPNSMWYPWLPRLWSQMASVMGEKQVKFIDMDNPKISQWRPSCHPRNYCNLLYWCVLFQKPIIACKFFGNYMIIRYWSFIFICLLLVFGDLNLGQQKNSQKLISNYYAALWKVYIYLYSFHRVSLATIWKHFWPIKALFKYIILSCLRANSNNRCLYYSPIYCFDGTSHITRLQLLP